MNDIQEDSDLLIISEIKQKNKNGDLYQISNELYNNMNIKISCILFILYFILNTDIFVENVLSKYFNNTYDNINDKITEKGIIISGIVLSLSYIILDILDKKKYI